MTVKANFGWAIHVEGETNICATMWTEQGPVITIEGFISRNEAVTMISTYLVLLASSRGDKATALLHEFVARVQ